MYFQFFLDDEMSKKINKAVIDSGKTKQKFFEAVANKIVNEEWKLGDEPRRAKNKE